MIWENGVAKAIELAQEQEELRDCLHNNYVDFFSDELFREQQISKMEE